MQQFRPSAERTRSKRWRSGTRRNKQHHATSRVVCPNLGVCLVHTPGHPDMTLARRPKAMAMRLTRCEQAWVDDIRSGHVHVHLCDYGRDSRRERRFRAIRMILRTLENPTGRLRRSQPMPQNVKPVMGIDYGHPNSGVVTKEGRTLRLAEIHRRIPQSMDISDRWYPSGE
jgi:hypothetical protein